MEQKIVTQQTSESSISSSSKASKESTVSIEGYKVGKTIGYGGSCKVKSGVAPDG